MDILSFGVSKRRPGAVLDTRPPLLSGQAADQPPLTDQILKLRNLLDQKLCLRALPNWEL